MTIPVFPHLHGFPIKKKPVFASIGQTVRSGREVQKFQNLFPFWEFELTFERLADQTQNATPIAYWSGLTQFRQVSEFFVGLGGPFGRFFFEDLTDNSRVAQSLGPGNGTEVNFLFMRTIASGSSNAVTITEPVGGVNLDEDLMVYLNGVEIDPSEYTVSEDLTTLVFNDPIPNGYVVTASFHYYYLCRFIQDDVDFEQFLYGRWSTRSLKFRSILRYGNLLPYDNWWSELILRRPPEPPVPPVVPSPPTLDSYEWAIQSFLGLHQSVSLIGNNRSGSGGGLSSTYEGIVAVALLAGDNTEPGIAVGTVTSASGLVFTQKAAFTQTGVQAASPYMRYELWTAPSPGLLNGENITATLNHAVDNIVMIAIAIKGVTAQGDPSTPNPVTDSALTSDTPPYPEVSFTLSGVSDFVLWIAGGSGINTNGIFPSGFVPGCSPRVASKVFDGTISLAFSWKALSGGASLTVQPAAAWRGAGSCIAFPFVGT